MPGCTSITFWTNRWRLFRSLIVGQFLLTCPGQKAHEKQRRNEFHCFVCTYKLVILWSFMIILFVNCAILYVQLLVLQLMFYSVSLAYMFRLPTVRFLLISFWLGRKTVLLQGNHSWSFISWGFPSWESILYTSKTVLFVSRFLLIEWLQTTPNDLLFHTTCKRYFSRWAPSNGIQRAEVCLGSLCWPTMEPFGACRTWGFLSVDRCWFNYLDRALRMVGGLRCLTWTMDLV